MDILAATAIFNKFKKTNENFENNDIEFNDLDKGSSNSSTSESSTSKSSTSKSSTSKSGKKQRTTFAIIMMILWLVLFVAFGSWAAWLSWDANTLVEWGTLAKSIFSFFAFLNGLSYLLGYLIYKWDLVTGLRSCKKPVVIPQSQAF